MKTNVDTREINDCLTHEVVNICISSVAKNITSCQTTLEQTGVMERFMLLSMFLTRNPHGHAGAHQAVTHLTFSADAPDLRTQT